MKNVFFISVLALCAFFLTACEKEPVEICHNDKIDNVIDKMEASGVKMEQGDTYVTRNWRSKNYTIGMRGYITSPFYVIEVGNQTAQVCGIGVGGNWRELVFTFPDTTIAIPVRWTYLASLPPVDTLKFEK